MKNRVALMLVLTASGASLPACGTASDTAGPDEAQVNSAPSATTPYIERLRAERAELERRAEEAGLTYTINVEANHIVRFTIPEDNSAILLGERMLREQTSVLAGLESLTVGEIVDKLNPGAELPPRLEPFRNVRPLQAETAAAPETATPPADIAEPDLVDKHATSSGTHFRDEHRACPRRLNYGGFPFDGHNFACETNMVRVSRSVNATHSGAVIGTYRASTVLSFHLAGTFKGSISILQGEIVSWAGMSGQFRECLFWSCGEWQVRTQSHSWVSDSSAESGAHHYGAVWITRPSATRGFMWPIIG
jgi:hypothetical protein